MTWTQAGYQALTAQQVIDEINALFIQQFGTDWNTNPASPNGQFVNGLATQKILNQNALLFLFQLYNPSTSQGLWLDAICSLSGIKRKSATNSTAICTCYGSAGTIIPANSQIKSTSGDLFNSVSTATIDSSGSVQIEFIAQQTGEVLVDVNTLTIIVSTIYGWDNVTNLTAGIVGNSQQSDFDLAKTRSSILSKQGSASLSAIQAGLIEVSDVTSVFALENNTTSPITQNGITLQPTQIYIAVLGGTDTAVATAIYNKKSTGIQTIGNTTVPVVTQWGTSNNITFQRPTQTPLKVNISIVNSTNLPPTIIQDVKNAVVNNFYGQDTSTPQWTSVKIAETINVTRFYQSVANVGAWNLFSPITIQLATNGTPAESITLTADKIATLITDNVLVQLV